MAHGRRGYRPGPARVRSTDDRRGRRSAAEHPAAARPGSGRAIPRRGRTRRPRTRTRLRRGRAALAGPRGGVPILVAAAGAALIGVLGSFDIGAGLLAVSAFIGWAVAVAVVWGSDPAPERRGRRVRWAVGARGRLDRGRVRGAVGVLANRGRRDGPGRLPRRAIRAAGPRRHRRRRRRRLAARALSRRRECGFRERGRLGHTACITRTGAWPEARDRMKNLRSDHRCFAVIIGGVAVVGIRVPRSPDRERERAAGRRLLPGARGRLDQRRPAPAVQRGARRRGLRRRQLHRRGDTYPTSESFDAWVGTECVDKAFPTYTGHVVRPRDDIDIGYFYPLEENWGKGDRQMICYVTPVGVDERHVVVPAGASRARRRARRAGGRG